MVGPRKFQKNSKLFFGLEYFSGHVLTDEDIKDLFHRVKEGETKPKITDPEMTGSAHFTSGQRFKFNQPARNGKPAREPTYIRNGKSLQQF